MLQREWVFKVPIRNYYESKAAVIKQLAAETREAFPELKHVSDRGMTFVLRLLDMRVQNGLLVLTYSGEWITRDPKRDGYGD
jgi:hypothetical protein